MALYRATLKDLDEEQRLEAEAEKENKQLRADLAKANVQFRTADATNTRFEHMKADLAAAGRKQAAAAAELKTVRSHVLTLKSDLEEAKIMSETATDQLAEQVAEYTRVLSRSTRRTSLPCSAASTEQSSLQRS
eukprot:3738828-Pleurochrysis_carterae.AAC.1